MSSIESIMLIGILIIVGASHLLHLLDQLLGWPKGLVKILRERRRREIEETLDAIGIPTATRADIASAFRAEQLARYNDPREKCMMLLRSCTSVGHFTVGAQNAKTFPYFVDVMSECLKPGRREECAFIMLSYLKSEKISYENIDYVVGLKAGSPALAVTVADKLRKPVVLFRGFDQHKYNASDGSSATLFDGSLTKGKVAVMVDDSTTGGRKAFDCIDALRALGMSVDEFWVLFEPLGKGTRESLEELKGVLLRSVVKMDNAVIQELSRRQEER